MRILIETLDTVREINRWEIPDVAELIPDWEVLTALQRRDCLADLIGEGAEFCKNVEADTLEREIVAIEPDIEAGGEA